jgi:hypothetical protein
MDLIRLHNHNGVGTCEFCLKIRPKESMYMDLDCRAFIKLVCEECAADQLIAQYGALPANFRRQVV